MAEVQPVEASTRVRMLSDKLKRRAYESAMSRAGSIQKRSQEAVGKLLYTVDLVCGVFKFFFECLHRLSLFSSILSYCM